MWTAGSGVSPSAEAATHPPCECATTTTGGGRSAIWARNMAASSAMGRWVCSATYGAPRVIGHRADRWGDPAPRPAYEK